MRGRLRFLGLLVAMAVAAGCASKTDLGAILAADVGHTARGTSRVAMAATMRSPGMSVTFTQTGVFDYAHARGVLHAGDTTGVSEEVFLPPNMYLKLTTDAGEPLPHGKAWLKLSLKDAAGQWADMPFAAFPGEPPTSPADMLSFLFGISSAVTQLGTATVRGVQTVHYRVTIDAATAASKVHSPAGVAAFAKAFGRSALPTHVWVDEQGRVRRVAITLAPPKSAGAPAGARVTLTTEFYDFGVPVRVSAPPASEVVSSSRLWHSSGVSVAPDGGPSPPPSPSGTLTQAQARAAEAAIRVFWAGIGAGDLKAAAQAVVPAQRSCFMSSMKDAPRFEITSLKIVSARPDGTARAAVLFQVKAQAKVGGQTVPVSPAGVEWLQATKAGSAWYVDLQKSQSFLPPCAVNRPQG